jgi:hypothetical protein
MPQNQPDRTYLKRSLAISGGLHLALLPLLISTVPAMLGWALLTTSASKSAREATTVSYLTIERRPAQQRLPASRPKPARLSSPVVAAAAQPAPPVRAAVREPKPVERRVASAPARISQSALAPQTVRTVAFAGATSARRPAVSAAAVPEQPKEQVVAQPPVSVVAASPAPSPSPAAPDANSARVVDVPAGGWGQNFAEPIVADDADLTDLHTRYHDAAKASIEVDDSGHATHVVLPAGLSDDQRADLERRLMALHYIPAECNGLHCAGTLVITL